MAGKETHQRSKSGLLSKQKRPTNTGIPEVCASVKRDLSIRQKRPVEIEQKRPIYMAKEAYTNRAKQTY